MGLASKVRTWVQQSLGYYVHEVKTMPVGTDLATDLLYKIGIKPKVIFDVGANIGQTAHFYRAIYPDSSIYCFEPVPSTFDELRSNLKTDSKVKCNCFALGSANESFEIKTVTGASSVVNSLSYDFQETVGRSGQETLIQSIEVIRLDDYVSRENIDHIDILKIDTEGFEMQVLAGATETLQNQRATVILCEAGFMKQNTRNTYFVDLHEKLESYGYALFGMYEMGHIGFKKGKHYGNLLYVSRKFRETEYRNWQLGYENR
jgi:FkbM family methyltransferase